MAPETEYPKVVLFTEAAPLVATNVGLLVAAVAVSLLKSILSTTE